MITPTGGNLELTRMNLDVLFSSLYVFIGLAIMFLMDTLKRFILSKPAGRRLVTADIIIRATSVQVASS